MPVLAGIFRNLQPASVPVMAGVFQDLLHTLSAYTELRRDCGLCAPLFPQGYYLVTMRVSVGRVRLASPLNMNMRFPSILQNIRYEKWIDQPAMQFRPAYASAYAK
jgi:hypothetical protein